MNPGGRDSMLRSERVKYIGFHAALLTLVALTTLFIVEGILRVRYAEPERQATADVLAVQEHLVLRPDIGFSWRPNVSSDEHIVFDVRDIDFEPLSTDINGFVNHPDAIRDVGQIVSVDVVGLGDSFMEHAAHAFYERFGTGGLDYYSLAIHRQCPPQYTKILENYALPIRPRWIVYGVFENDFVETDDYENWRRSGLDWFAYHSGTWCGAPVDTNALSRFYKDRLRGVHGLSRVVRARLYGDGASVSGPTTETIGRTAAYVRAGYTLASDAGISFLLVLIPGRGTAISGDSAESRAYDALVADLAEDAIPTLDLRPSFIGSDNPASLYYEEDAHWNARGIEKAADAILEYVSHERLGE